MADNNDAPVQDTPDENQEAPEQEPVNEGGDAPEAEADEAQAEPAEPTEEQSEVAPSEEEENEPNYEPVDYSQFRNNDTQIPVNDDGTVDPVAFRNQLKQELRDEMRFERQEERNWQAVEKRHPQLRDDKEIREILLNQRIANAIQGKETNLVKLADRLYGRVDRAKSEGRAQANVSQRVQKAASLETATANSGEDKSDKLYDRIIGGDKGAASDLLGQWLEQGKI